MLLTSSEIDTIRKRLSQEWREFVNRYGGFDDQGMPRKPGMLPQSEAAEWQETLCFWNKAFVRAQISEERHGRRR